MPSALGLGLGLLAALSALSAPEAARSGAGAAAAEAARPHRRHAHRSHHGAGHQRLGPAEGASASPVEVGREVAAADGVVASAPQGPAVEDKDFSATLREAEQLSSPEAQAPQHLWLSAATAATGSSDEAAAVAAATAEPAPAPAPEGPGEAEDSLEAQADQQQAKEDSSNAQANQQQAKEDPPSAREDQRRAKEDPGAMEEARKKVKAEGVKDAEQMALEKRKEEEEEQKEDEKDKALDHEVEKAESQEGREAEEAEAKPAAAARPKETTAKAEEVPARHPSGSEDDWGAEAPRESKQLEKLEKDIARQTDSKGLADMLGSLEMDIYRLTDQLDEVKRKVKDGVRLKAEDPDKSLVYPMSMCTQCILLLAAQYFVVYTAMILCKLFTEAFDLGEGTRCEMSLRAACETVFYAPMLCALFLGAQLRAQQVTGGRGGPSFGAELAMEVCACAVLVQTLLVLAVPVLTGGAEVALIDEEGGALLPEFEGYAVSGLFTLVRHAALVSLLLGMAVVCVEVVFMDTRSLGVEPPDLWDDPTTARTEYAPPLSPATACAIALMVLFFAVYALRTVLRSCLELSAGADEDGEGARHFVATWEKYMETCSGAMNLAPMLCILFMALRVRALQVEPKLGQLPAWAEHSLYGCVASLAAHLVVVLCAWICGIQTSVGSATSIVDEARRARIASGISRTDVSLADSGDRFVIPSRTPFGEKFVLAARGLALGGTYACAVAAAAAVFALGAPAGRPTPAPAPAVRCAVVFAVMYLVVHLCLFLAQASAVLCLSLGLLEPPRHGRLLRAVRCLRMAEYTVKLCPMLGVLFLGARLRALQLGGRESSPQCWSQEAMYSAAIALTVQLVAVLGAAWLAPSLEVDETCGSPSAKKVAYVPGRVLLETVKICTFAALYGSVLAVGASMMAMRPETAHCDKLGAYLPFLAGLEG